VVEPAQPDRLELAWAQGEFVVPADLVVPGVVADADRAQAVGQAGRNPLAALVVAVVGPLVVPVEVRDAAARAVPGQLGRELGSVVIALPHVVARFGDGASAVEDQRRPTRCAAPGLAVVEPSFVFERAAPPADRHGPPGEQGIGKMRPRLAGPAELARQRARGSVDDIGDLAGQTGNVERRAVDDLDPGDVGRRNARQERAQVVGLGRRALPVEQHIARRLAEAAHVLAVADLEAGNLRKHVRRRLRGVAGEICRRVDLATLGGGRGWSRGRLGRRRIAGRRVLCQGRRSERAGGQQRQRGALHQGFGIHRDASRGFPSIRVRVSTSAVRASMKVIRRGAASPGFACPRALDDYDGCQAGGS
jgi:hypothetical protein